MRLPGVKRVLRQRGAWMTGVAVLGSGAAVAWSRDPVTVAMWGLIWLTAGAFAWRDRGSLAFYVWIAVGLFYPQASDRFGSMNEFATVTGASLLALVLTSVPAGVFAFRRSFAAGAVMAFWLAWGLAGYAPVLIGWAFRVSGLGDVLFPGIYVESSALKTAGPVLLAWAPAVGVLAAIRSAEGARRFFNFLMAVTVMFALLSLAQLAISGYQGSWVPVTYSVLPSRLHSISSPDANSTARQALPSLVLLLPLAVFGRRLVRPWLLWPALGAAALVVMLTVSRTAMVSTAAALVVIVLAEIRRRRTLMVAGGLVIATVVALGGLAVAGVLGADRLSLTNVTGRLTLYEAVWTVIAGHPVFGVHPGGYAAALAEAGYPRLISPHNMWFGVAAEWGLPMAAWLTGALVLTWSLALDGMRRLRRIPRTVDGWREARVMLVGAAALAATWTVHGISEIVPPELVFFTLGVALAARYRVIPEAARAAAALPRS